MSSVFVGVDVGTGSARAGLFDEAGRLLGSARHPIRIWRQDGAVVEQSSDDIWAAVIDCTREAVRTAGIPAAAIGGIGFDATCSLVVLDAEGAPLPVGPSGDSRRNVVVWMDHRAGHQTRRINATDHSLLRYSGGALSPEMQVPKLLWLKENRPETFAKAGHFLDLADFLSWRATGSLQRSACTLTCKWTYLAHERRWDAEFLRAIGLGGFAEEGFARIGAAVVAPGEPVGQGLSAQAASALGLRPGTPVAASLIDAHAGALATLGARRVDGRAMDPSRDVALIMGTSSCIMALTREPIFMPGLWGPYLDGVLPGYWLVEGGQSAYGAALDALVAMHPAFPCVSRTAAREGLSVLDHLERRAVALAGSVETAALLAEGIHVVPEFLGHRSPDADPGASAVLAGLRLDGDEDGLVRLFVAGLCGLSYGTRRIVEAIVARGVRIETITVSGGAARSALLRRIIADVTGRPIALPETPEPVLLGAAMLGAVAGGAHPDLARAAAAMGRMGEEIAPAGGEMAAFHARKARAHDILQHAGREARRAMEGGA